MASRWMRFPVLIVMTLAASLLWSGLERPATAEQPKRKPTLTKFPGGERITRPDGSSTERWTDGTIIDKRPGGTKVTQRPGGTVITEIPGIGTLTRRPDGTKIVNRADGSSSEREDVVRFFESLPKLPDGTIIEGRPDGTTVVTGPGGTRTYSKLGRLLSVKWWDGVTTTYDADGRRTTVPAPGQPKKATVSPLRGFEEPPIQKSLAPPQPTPGQKAVILPQARPAGTLQPPQPGAGQPTPVSIRVAPIQKSFTPPQQGAQPTKKAPATGLLIGQ